MIRRGRIFFLSFLTICLLISCSKEETGQTEHRNIRNVILIAIDTLRADNLGFMGYDRPTSPFMDEFSRRCVIFDRAYTPKARTLPAFVSLFSAEHVIRHRINNNGIIIPEELHFLTEDFRDAGFLTVGYPAAQVLSSKYDINRGFDFYGTIKKGIHELPASEIVNLVRRFLEGNPSSGEMSFPEQSKPLYLFIHFFDPHTDYTPDPSILKLFADPDYDGPFDGKLIPIIRDYKNQELELNKADLQHAVDMYDAEIRTLDDHLRDLFDLFRRTGLMENSVIVFTADHGENLGEHNHITHGHPYEQSLHIPLMLHFPGDFGAGTRIDSLVELTDVLPTVMDITGIPIPEGLDGVSFFPVMKSPNSSEAGRQYLLARGVEGKDGTFSHSLYDGTYRLMKDIFWSEESVLYNIAEDKFETNDIAAENPKLVEIMEVILESMIAKLEEKDETSVNPVRQDLDPEEEEMLRSLGYLN